jgi:hypothetical protein
MSGIYLDVPSIKVLVRQEGETRVSFSRPDVGVLITGSFVSFAENSLTSISSSYALTASYVEGDAGITDWLEITNIPEGLVSSSTQAIDWSVASASVAVSSSFAITASYFELPDGIVSSSNQITLQDTIGNLSASRINGTVESALTASYIAQENLPTGLISSSVQVSYPELQNIPAEIVSSSTQAINWSVASASAAISASYALSASYIDGGYY